MVVVYKPCLDNPHKKTIPAFVPLVVVRDPFSSDFQLSVVPPFLLGIARSDLTLDVAAFENRPHNHAHDSRTIFPKDNIRAREKRADVDGSGPLNSPLRMIVPAVALSHGTYTMNPARKSLAR